MSKDAQVMEKIVALCRRRGFIFGSSEIYGGIGGFWDYGPLGCELKRNIKSVWWQDMVTNPPPGPDERGVSMVGLDSAIIMNPKVWEASGHVGGFADPMVDCTACKRRFRADEITAVFFTVQSNGAGEEASFEVYSAVGEAEEVLQGNQKQIDKSRKANRIGEESAKTICLADADIPDLTYVLVPCPGCREKGVLTRPRQFNLMFETHVGALQDASSVAYLRPETAQGIFANFKNVMDSSRVKIPFGIAQIGKAFRNEINPRNYTFRSREFEQMEIEFFCHPKESRAWYEFWRDVRLKWYEQLGIKSERLRAREQGDEELAHYSDACTDVEYLFPFAEETQELEGIAHRGDFDLKAHGRKSKNKEDAFAVIDDQSRQRYVPHVIEPSAGVDRFALAAICEAYTVDESRPSPELLKFHPRLAPIKAAVFPLVAKDGLPEVAEPIYRQIKDHYVCQLDIKQSIGKRYARMDEAGTPFCFTVDGQTLEDGTVTVRDRNTGNQKRIDKGHCVQYLRDELKI